MEYDFLSSAKWKCLNAQPIRKGFNNFIYLFQRGFRATVFEDKFVFYEMFH